MSTPRTGISNVTGIVWVPANGRTTTPSGSGPLTAFNAVYRERDDGPQLDVLLIPDTKSIADMFDHAAPPLLARFHGRPRPWKTNGRTSMAVMIDKAELHELRIASPRTTKPVTETS